MRLRGTRPAQQGWGCRAHLRAARCYSDEDVCTPWHYQDQRSPPARAMAHHPFKHDLSKDSTNSGVSCCGPAGGLTAPAVCSLDGSSTGRGGMTALSSHNPDDNELWDEQDEQYEPDSGELDLADRHALRRVAGLSTELEDISEVEYRALRLERVVLMPRPTSAPVRPESWRTSWPRTAPTPSSATAS